MSIEQSRDPKQFSAFELSGWDANIRGYDSAFGAVARQTVGSMLDAAGVKPAVKGELRGRARPRCYARDHERGLKGASGPRFAA